jgi:hypothetical protein
MTAKNDIKFVLEFPQGRMLFLKTGAGNDSDPAAAGGVYFLPPGGADAFMVYGDRKELFGKNAITVSRGPNVQVPYSLVYEFSAAGALLDGRLVSADLTTPGKLLGADVVQQLNHDLAEGAITLRSPQDTLPVQVHRAAQFPDGRLLLQLSKDQLYLGKPGNYQKLDAELTLIGGSSKYYRLADGGNIGLPGRTTLDEGPTFKGERLVYLDIRGAEDPARFGLSLPAGLKAQSPFSEPPSDSEPSKPAPRRGPVL